jgi:opacity protein-like surface antigen
MNRVYLAAVLAVGVATPAVAQFAGMPVWNSPKGGTGITISGDYGKPNADAGKGNAFGARGTVGLGSLSLTAGFSTWKPSGATNSLKSIGGDAAFRVIGGSLLPINLNLLVGGARTTVSGASGNLTTLIAGGGVSVSLPTPGVTVEPYVSVANRWHKPSGGSTDSNIGWTIGANLGFGMLGAHIAYDSESLGGGTTAGVLGVGLHLALNVPMM